MASANFGSSYVTRPRTIEVPLQHEQVLEVVCNDLPSNPTELTDIFRQEKVDLSYYRMLAIEYYEQDKISQSISVVQAGLANASHLPHTLPRQKLPLLTLIATLHMRLAKKETEDRKRQKCLEEATQYINEADRIHNQHEPTFVVKGNLYILLKKLDDAARSFNMVLEKRPNCIPALLGKAKIQYHLQQYKQSLKSYQTALKYSRGRFSAVEIRLGIAQCFAQLKMYPEAKAALKRCIEVGSSPNATALIMLSIIELNDSKNPELGLAQQEVALRHGLQHMHKAHKANKRHPAVLNMMANHFFLTRDFEKTMRAASRAMKRATNNVSKAEASYQIARAHHQMQEFEKAYKFYRQALDLNADHILAQFGMGQMQLKRGEYTLAIDMFEKLHKSEPECIEVMKVLASLYGISGKKEQSLALFNKILTNTNDDPLMAMEVAEMYEETDGAKALEYYEQSLSLLDNIPEEELVAVDRVNEIKPELLNNIAVMHHSLHHSDEAERYYSLAIQESETPKESETEKHLKLTMSYNLARLYEDRCESDKAAAIYRKITEDYPSYADAHLRLGAIEQQLGRATEAIEHYKEVFDSNPNDSKAWIMIGQAQATINEKLCKRSYEKVLKDCDKNNIYTHIALGNYHAAAAREMKQDKSRQQREESYKLAVNFYSQALRRDPTNAYAANGLAITIAEKGHLEQARDLFNQVRETMVSNASVWVNLAHIYVELKQFKQAIVMYENASRKFFSNKDTNILLCLARAQYILSKTEKDPEIMYEAMKNTQKAILIHPSDKTTHYNLALVQQSYAQQVSDLPQEQRSSTNMKRAIKCLECGQQTFRMLINVPVDEFVWYDRKIAEQRERYGETLRTQLERKIVDQVSYEQEKEQKLQVARKKRNDERAKELAAKEKIREEEALRRSELEETRRKLMEKVREDNLQMATQQMELDEFEEEKKSKKRTRKRRDNDDDIERDPEEEEYERLLNKKDKKSFKSKRIIEDSDEEEYDL